MRKHFLLVFFLTNLLLSSFYIDTWDNGNTTSRMLMVYYAVNEGTLQVDKQQERVLDKSFVNGHYYSDKAPLPAFIVMPVYKLFRLLGAPPAQDGKLIYVLGSFICGCLPFALIVLLTYREVSARNAGVSAVALSMLPFFGSLLFVYSGTFYNHMLSGLFLLLAYVFLKKEKWFYSGLFAGLCFISEYLAVLVAAIWLLQLFLRTKQLKPAVLFGLGFLPSAVAIMIYNYLITGSPFTMLYKYHTFEQLHSDYGFSNFSFDALWGITFSWYRGVFIYAPVLLVILFVVIRSLKGKHMRAIAPDFFRNYLVPAFVVILLVECCYFGWFGGWSYGPRLLIFLVIPAVYEGVKFLSSMKIPKLFFYVTVLAGFACAFAAKTTVVYSLPTEIRDPLFDGVFPNFFSFNFHPNNLGSMLLGLAPAIAAILFVVLFASALFLLDRLQHPVPDKDHG